jgi:hypothetical protein
VPGWDQAAINAGVPLNNVPAGALPGGGGPPSSSSLLPSGKTLAQLGGAAVGGLLGNEAANQAGGQGGLDPRLEPFLYGQNGLMPMTQGLLQQQAPIAQQAGQQFMQFGQGLLGRPVAGNPFLK